jgi:hypothetical protein
MEHTVKSDTAHPAGTEHTARVTVQVSGTPHKKKKTSSRGVRRLTQIDRRVSKSVRRLTRAVDNGVDSYIEHRDKSAEKRKDGVVVDFVENVSYGVSKTISDASPILHDIAEAWNTRRLRTQIRRVARTFGNIPFFG